MDRESIKRRGPEKNHGNNRDEKHILEGRTKGRKQRGRGRIKMMDDIRGREYERTKRKAEDRI